MKDINGRPSSREARIGGAAVVLHRKAPEAMHMEVLVPTSLEIRDEVQHFLLSKFYSVSLMQRACLSSLSV